MSTTKPTILWIPGSFSSAYLYDNVAAIFKSLGYPFEIASLPSSSRKPPEPAATLAEDVKFYSDILSKLCHQEGKNVVVVGHSYGGMVSTETVKGFTDSTSGKGKVIGIVYLTCLVPKVGNSLQSMMKDEPTLDFIKMDGEYMYHDPPEISAKVNYSDVPLEKGLEMVKHFTYHSGPSFAGETQYEGYRDVDNVAFIFCTKDATLLPDFQKRCIQNINDGREGKSQCKVYELESGHIPTYSQPENTSNLIAKAIEDFS